MSWLNKMAQLKPIAITVDYIVATVMLILESSPNCEIYDMKIRPTNCDAIYDAMLEF